VDVVEAVAGEDVEFEGEVCEAVEEGAGDVTEWS
jgi:hypothetical protein